MADNPIGVFGPDDDDDFGKGPVIDVTPMKEEPESNETDGHILDDLIQNQKLDRSDRTQEDSESSGGFIFAVIGLVLFIALLIFLIF